MVRFLGAFAMLPTAHFLERIGQLERFLHALRELAGVEPALERGCFLRLVARKARHEIFEVDLVAVEVRPVDARELDLAADLDAAAAAHAGAVDHDRVHVTMVLMPRGRVASAQAFIITGGPMAMTSSISGCFFSARSMPSVTKPRMPTEPSLVHRISSSQTLSNWSFQQTRSCERKPSTPMTLAPASLHARA